MARKVIVMLSAKDIREVKFTRSMGGYKTVEVDEFLDRCADAFEEMASQQEENAKKMQVLAETIMDYRNQEDSIRSALISAQKMSETVIKEAREQANDILDAARTEAETIHESLQSQIVSEQEELARVKREVAEFKANLLAIYRDHLNLINVLEGDEAEEEVESEEEEATSEEAEVEAPAEQTEEPAVEEESDEEQPASYDMPDFSALEIIDEE